jgi:hypothetical protein
MGLFSIFKKKPEPKVVVVPTDSIKGLIDGILFEDGTFLKWGSDIEADKLYTKKEFRADRTIYHWGERYILNGLTLYFKTVCWNHKQHGNIKSFESITFLEESDKAGEYFESIRKHLQPKFGDPSQPEDIQPGDTLLEWKIKAIKISLSLFNRDQPKVNLEIGWWL